MKKWKELPNKIGMRKQMLKLHHNVSGVNHHIIVHVSYAYEHA